MRACTQNFGVDVNTGGVVDTFSAFVWEPSLVKYNAIQSATEAACLILRCANEAINSQVQNGVEPLASKA